MKEAVIQAILAFIIALSIFGPITGIILHGYHFQIYLQTPIILATIVMIGRFFIVYATLTSWGKSFLESLLQGRHQPIQVATSQPTYGAFPGLLLIGGLMLPFLLKNDWLSVIIIALIYIILGLGLNIVVGLAGLLNLGFAAFYAIGAYTLALGAKYWEIGFWTALPLAGLIAALCGALLSFPVLRLHGDYLAIVTLGFGEIIRLFLNNLTFTGGPNGLSTPFPTCFGLEFTRIAKQGGIPFHQYFGIEYSSTYRYIFTYLILVTLVTLLIIIINRLKNLPLGRAWEALREDEIAGRALGINQATIKLAAFSISAGIGGIAGVLFAGFQGFINPTSFNFFESVLILAIVVLGGMGSTLGTVLAALMITILPEALRDQHLADYRILIFGLLMIMIMIWRPSGLIRMQRRAFNVKGL